MNKQTAENNEDYVQYQGHNAEAEHWNTNYNNIYIHEYCRSSVG